MALTTCYECGKTVSDRAVACPHCGAPSASTLPTCDDCGHAIEPGSAICANCGAPADGTINGHSDDETGSTILRASAKDVFEVLSKHAKLTANRVHALLLRDHVADSSEIHFAVPGKGARFTALLVVTDRGLFELDEREMQTNFIEADSVARIEHDDGGFRGSKLHVELLNGTTVDVSVAAGDTKKLAEAFSKCVASTRV